MPWRQSDSLLLRSLATSRLTQLALLVLTACVLLAVLAPWLASQNPFDPAALDLLDAFTRPGEAGISGRTYWLGADDQGRDVLSAILYGLRMSVLVGGVSVLLSMLIGVGLGVLAGYRGGWVDALIMRLADVQLSFSTLMVAIFLSAIFQAIFGVAAFENMAVPFLVLVIGIAEWPQYARTVRASVLAEKKKEYVEAARVIGLPSGRIMWRHILPNTMSPLMVLSTVQVAHAIMSEAALSFLGLGMPITKPSLGSLINSGFEYIFSGAWWITTFPGVLLVVLILVINLLGDWVQDVLNPKLYKG